MYGIILIENSAGIIVCNFSKECIGIVVFGIRDYTSYTDARLVDTFQMLMK